VQEPYEGCLGRMCFGTLSGEAKRRLIDTLWRGWLWRFAAASAKRVRGGRGKPWSRLSPVDPGRVKPKGGTGGRWLKNLSVTRHSWKG
jgi:hypothetical protein